MPRKMRADAAFFGRISDWTDPGRTTVVTVDGFTGVGMLEGGVAGPELERAAAGDDRMLTWIHDMRSSTAKSERPCFSHRTRRERVRSTLVVVAALRSTEALSSETRDELDMAVAALTWREAMVVCLSVCLSVLPCWGRESGCGCGCERETRIADGFGNSRVYIMATTGSCGSMCDGR